MAYTFDPIFAADPNNPANVAANASILIFDPSDPGKAPVTITDPTGSPIANPVTVNKNGFGTAFQHETLDRLGWSGGGFEGYFTSYEGMKAEAVAARSAAETAAADAGTEAAAVATAAIGTATDEATAAAASASSAATAAANSATAAANSAALVGAPADPAIAAAVSGTSTETRAALNLSYGPDAAPMKAAFTGRPTAPEVTYYVTPRGNDTNDGLTLTTAKATIGAALTAAGANRPRIVLGVGAWIISEDIQYPYGAAFIGAGTGLTRLTYSGTGTMFSSATPDARTFYTTFQNMSLIGPGKTSTATAISLDSVSDATLKDVTISTFGTGVRIKSSISGGAVYNVLEHVNTTSCTTGIKIEAIGSNCTRIFSGRANNCTTGLDITDSNNTIWMGGSFEVNTTGVKVTATSSSLADQNIIAFARFEGNTTAWNVTSSNVRDFQVLYPALFSTYTVIDNGSRTTHWGNTYTIPSKTVSPITDAAGSWKYDRIANGGTETPAMHVVDSATTSGTPVTVQATTERVAGYFFRGKRGGTTYFDVRADGLISGGSSTTAARPTGTIRAGAQWFDTTLNKPIWYNGTAWVDATGTTV